MKKITRPRWNRHQKKELKKTQACLFVLMIILSVIIGLLSYKASVWNLTIGLIVLGSLLGLFIVVLFMKYYINWRKTTVVLQLLYCVVCGFILYFGFNVYTMTKTINANFSQLNYKLKVVTLSNNSIFTLPQVSTAILAPTGVDGEYIEKLIKDMEVNANTPITIKNIDSYISAYQSLVSKSTQAIVMNSAEESVIFRQYPNYYQSVKSIYEYTNSATEKIKLPISENQISTVLIGITNANWDIKADASLSSAELVAKNERTGAFTKNSIDLSTIQTVDRSGQLLQVSLGELGLIGKEKLVDAINRQENVTINHILLIDYTKLLNLLDIFNNVFVENDSDFYSKENNMTFFKGQLQLNKDQARLFMSDTYAGFENRQKTVVNALLKKISAQYDIVVNKSALDILSSAIKSDMSIRQLINILLSLN